MKLNKLLTLALAAIFMTALSGCGDDDDAGTPVQLDTIVEIAAGDPNFSILVDALETNPDLLNALNGSGTYTVFAPTNDAFIALLGVIGQTSLEDIPTDVITRILQYHVVSGAAVASGDLTDGQMVATELNGEEVTVSISGGTVSINGATVVTADVEASNGVIHVIDAVLVPELEASIVNTIVEPAYFNNDFSILTEAVVTADLLETLIDPAGTYTLFAPTNSAFEAAGITSLDGLTGEDLAPILTYHVLDTEILAGDLPSTEGGLAATVGSLGGDFYLTNNAGGVAINGNSNVVTTDLSYDNGIVHVIDRTLLPPTIDVVQIAIDNGFNELAAALTEAGLVQTLQGNGPFTVFAPTDDAFNALYDALEIDGPADVDPLLGDGTLSAILTYHVVGARAFSSDLFDGLSPETLQGGTVEVSIDGGVVTLIDKDPDVADPTVTGTDVLGTNGVVHIIDGILLPIDTAL